jgi:PAS domain S-box-containing protein
LVIESDSSLANRILSNLMSFQYTILPVAIRSADVFEQLKTHDPDLIILDLEFAGDMDGITLGEAIHSSSNKPIVLLTDKSDNLAHARVQAINPYGFVLKNFDTYRFPAVISIALQKYRTECQLRASEERLRLIADFTYDWEYWRDKDGQFIYISPSVERITGYTQAELFKDPNLLDVMVHPQDREISRDHSQRHKINPGITEIKVRIITKDGRIRWLQHICQPVIDENGKFLGNYATNHDITEQQKAEMTLIENEKRYRSLFEDSRVSLWEEDFSDAKLFIDGLLDGGVTNIPEYFHDHPDQFSECISRIKILDINKAGLAMYNLPDKESVFENAGKIFRAADKRLMLNELQALADGVTVYDDEGVNLDLDGNPVDVQIHWSMSPDVPDKYSRVLVSIVDVTSRRSRERSLELISTISLAVREAKNRMEMLQVIDDQITRVFHTTGWAAALTNTDRSRCTIERASGHWEYLTGTTFESADPLFRHFFADDQPVIYLRGDHLPSAVTIADDYASLHRILCPLIAEEQVLGAMVIGRESPFTDNDKELLHSLSNILAVALYRTSLLDKTRKFADQMAAISTLGQRLTQTLNLKEIYKHLAEGVLQICPDVMNVFILSLDSDVRTYHCDFWLHKGKEIDVSRFSTFPLWVSVSGSLNEVIRSRQPLVIDRYNEYLLQSIKNIASDIDVSRIMSGVFIPLVVKNEILGVLHLHSSRENCFTQSDIDLLLPLASTGAIAIKNSRLFTETNARFKRLSMLRTIDLAISSNLDMKVTMNVLIHELMAFLEFKAVDILLYDPGRQLLEFCTGRGIDEPALENLSIRLGEGMAGKAALENRVVIYSPSEKGEYTELPGVFYSPGVHKSYVAVPMMSKGQIKGVIEAYFSDKKHLTTEWLQFLETLAGQVAIALDNNALVSELKRSNQELVMAYDSTLEGWSKALDLRDRETEGHSHRVMELTIELAAAFGLQGDDLLHIRRGALLHDIGKMGIPDSILLKEGPLTDDEWIVMRKHPVYAFEMLSTISYLSQALDIPYCHHEHWDGQGYPRGLKGEQIPLAARIFAVADVYDSLVSDRPYRKAWTKEKALEQIRKEAGTHLDTKIVDVFLRLME